MNGKGNLHEDVLGGFIHGIGETMQEEDLQKAITPTVHKMVDHYQVLLRQGLEMEVKRILQEFDTSTTGIESAIARRIRGTLLELIQHEVRRVFEDTLSHVEGSPLDPKPRGGAPRPAPKQTGDAPQDTTSQPAPASRASEPAFDPWAGAEDSLTNSYDSLYDAPGSSVARPTEQPEAPETPVHQAIMDEPAPQALLDEAGPQSPEAEALQSAVEMLEPLDLDDDFGPDPLPAEVESVVVAEDARPVEAVAEVPPAAEPAEEARPVAQAEPVDVAPASIGPTDEDMPSPADDDVYDQDLYEGTVRISVEADACISRVVQFVRELRQKPQFRLLRLVGNKKSGVNIWLGLREPLDLKKILPQIEGVTRVRTLSSTGPDGKERLIAVQLAHTEPEQAQAMTTSDRVVA